MKTAISQANKELRAQISARERLERKLVEISEHERRRFGMDLHDDLCQQLAGIALSAAALSKGLSCCVEESAAVLRLATAISAAINQARDIARGLHPVELANGGLSAALHDCVARVTQEVECRFEYDGETPALSIEVELALFRIAQEAIRNAVRHANPSLVTVHLACDKDRLELTVEGDGEGMPPAKSEKGLGMGIEIMRYRAASIGATLKFEPMPEKGTRAKCRLPLFINRELEK